MKIERFVNTFGTNDISMAHIVATTDLNTKNKIVHKKQTLTFYVKTYMKLGPTYGEGEWFKFFNLTNKFISELDKESSNELYNFYVHAHRALIVDDVVGIVPKTVILNIQKLVADLIKKTDLCQKLITFIQNSDLVFPNLENIGKRAHDSEEKTFREPEYKILTALSLFGKLMSPIWGDFIYKTQKIVRNADKEYKCYQMIEPSLERGVFSNIHRKFHNYVDNWREKQLKQSIKGSSPQLGNDIEFTTAHGGYGDDRMTDHIYGMLIVKKLALYDPIKDVSVEGVSLDRDLMKYVTVNIQTTVNSLLKNLQHGSTVMVRRVPNMGTAVSEQDSITILESESRISIVSADVTMKSKLGAISAINLFIKEGKLGKGAYNECVRYYTKHIVNLNPIAKLIISMMVSPYMGGSGTLNYLDHMSVTKLIAMIQLKMCEELPHQIVHMLTSINSGEKANVIEPVAQRIRMSYATSAEFNAVLSMYPYILGPHRSVKSQLELIINYITTMTHRYNTAPVITNKMDIENVEYGEILKYDAEIINDICNFILKYGGASLMRGT